MINKNQLFLQLFSHKDGPRFIISMLRIRKTNKKAKGGRKFKVLSAASTTLLQKAALDYQLRAVWEAWRRGNK